MSSLLEYVSTFVENAILWMRSFLAFIVGGTVGTGNDAVTYTAQPVLILFIICLPIVGLGIGLLKRLIKIRG